MSKFSLKKSVAIPSNGTIVSIDVSGSYFICTKAVVPFKVSFDGQTFCDWEKGLSTKSWEFNRISFHALPNTVLEQTVEFYHGTAEVSDSRFNVINDAQLATILVKEPAFTTVPILSPGGAYIWAPGDVKTVPGLIGASPNFYPLRAVEWVTMRKGSGPAEESILTLTMNGAIVASSFTGVPGRLVIGKPATRAGNIITPIDVLISHPGPALLMFSAYLNATYWATPVNLQDL